MLRKWIFLVLSLVCVSAVYAAEAPQPTPAPQTNEIIEGVHYIKLPNTVPQQAVVQTYLAQDKGKIQVAEFFSYKCPGCYALEGDFNAWAAKQPKDVAIRRVPVSFGPNWEPLAKAYFVIEQMGKVHELNPVIFNAVHKDRKPLETQSEIALLLSQHGVKLDEFNAAYEGFNVNRLWTQAQLLRQSEEVGSVPAVVVNGEYLTHIGLTQDPKKLMQVLDYLIEKVRKGE